jgi:hypothetical protein
MSTTHLTTKQHQILALIAGKNPDGSLLDLDQLLDRLPYETTKQSIHFSIRALVNRKMIKKAGQEKRRDRRRGLLDLDVNGALLYGAARGSSGPSVVVSEEEDMTDRLLSASL